MFGCSVDTDGVRHRSVNTLSMMASMLCSFLLLSILFSVGSEAAEVDQFSRDESVVLSDSRDALNAEVERRIHKAVERANRKPMHLRPKKLQPRPWKACSPKRLFQKLQESLARPLIGQVESYAEAADAVDRYHVAFEESVYREFNWIDSPSLVLSERVAAVVRLGNVELGTDKFGHFFTEGYRYYIETAGMTRPLKHAFLFGEWTESVYFGAQTTGVYSFADLVANFQGLRFWNRVLGDAPDPLTGKATSPYIACDGERWVIQEAFDWTEYVDPAWDESVNCSLFRHEDLLAEVLNHAPQCQPRQLPWRRYGELAPRLFNQHGLGVMPEYLQPEVILLQMAPEETTDARVDWVRTVRQDLETWRTRQRTSSHVKEP